jgi:putative endonuclease
MNSYQIGLFAEFIAASFLRLKGYKILTKRFKTKFGEIDIIARKNNYIIFIEVKMRKDRAVFNELITKKHLKRQENAAQIFLKKTKENLATRFDLIFISPPLYLQHIKNII